MSGNLACRAGPLLQSCCMAHANSCRTTPGVLLHRAAGVVRDLHAHDPGSTGNKTPPSLPPHSPPHLLYWYQGPNVALKGYSSSHPTHCSTTHTA